MSATVATVRKAALALNTSERANLAHELIVSLDDPADWALSPEQETEIQRRIESINKGRAKGRPADQVFAEIRGRVKK